MEFLNRLWVRLRHRRFDEDLREELRLHEEMKREALERAGMAAGEARAEARRALGNVALAREEARGVWIATWIESLVQDVRYAVRSLARQPLHAITSTVVLVLAIGVNASLFTTFKGLALEPWPGRDPNRIVQMRAVARGQVIAPSVDEYRLVRAQASSFTGVAAHMYGGAKRLRAAGRAETSPQSGSSRPTFSTSSARACTSAPGSSPTTTCRVSAGCRPSSATTCGGITWPAIRAWSARPSP